MYESIRDRLLRHPSDLFMRKSEGGEFTVEDMVEAARANGDYGNDSDDVVSEWVSRMAVLRI